MKTIAALMAGGGAAALMLAQPALAANGTSDEKAALIGAGLLAAVGALAFTIDDWGDEAESP